MNIKPGSIFLSRYATDKFIIYVRDIDYSGLKPDYSCFIFSVSTVSPEWELYGTYSTNVFNNEGSLDQTQKRLAFTNLFSPNSIVLALTFT